jgi:hypothetical protein
MFGTFGTADHGHEEAKLLSHFEEILVLTKDLAYLFTKMPFFQG